MEFQLKRFSDAGNFTKVCILIELPSVLIAYLLFILPFYTIKKTIHYFFKGACLFFFIAVYLLRSLFIGANGQPVEPSTGDKKLKSTTSDKPIRESKRTQRSIRRSTEFSNEISLKNPRRTNNSDNGAEIENHTEIKNLSEDFEKASGGHEMTNEANGDELTNEASTLELEVDSLCLSKNSEHLEEESSDEDSPVQESQDEVQFQSYGDFLRNEIRKAEYTPPQLNDDYSDFVFDHFEIGRFLGQGTYASVRVCKAIGSETEFACKILPKDKNSAAEVKKEMNLMTRLHGDKNIVELHEFFEDQVNYYMIMDFCKGRTLKNRLDLEDRLHPDEAKCIFKQLVRAVRFCHFKGILHRDLKPENILLCDTPDANGLVHIKLADFGFSKSLRKSTTHISGVAGTTNYAAPESINSSIYGPSSELFSLGCILYEMLYGVPAYDGEDDEETEELIINGMVDYEDNYSNVPYEALSLLQELLVEEDYRASLDDILNHPYLE